MHETEERFAEPPFWEQFKQSVEFKTSANSLEFQLGSMLDCNVMRTDNNIFYHAVSNPKYGCLTFWLNEEEDFLATFQ
uniref:Uncharacterized protein n=1 Tax=Globodera rostochiensis TaxID=31243 RepID=A0A914I4A4_GLORO